MNQTSEINIFDYLSATDMALSRTMMNKSVSLGTSPKKRKSLLEGDELISQNNHNRRLVSEYIQWKHALPPRQSGEVFGSLLTLAELTGLKLFPEGIYRLWVYEGSHGLMFPRSEQIDPKDIFSFLLKFSDILMARLKKTKSTDEGLRIVAGAEWDISVGPIHPFYDACGRISRYYSTLLCLWLSLPVVQRGARDMYFDHANQGREAFKEHFLSYPRIFIANI